ncbi:MAG: type II toxin-antitoxin system VapC family toxin [candidate division NC10 bacterium]|nr:type II toxin-antitoxin system VapC family toxin [candidate division NC10 bacterium]MDE2321079.1 type II toxin-antitoxin system VapC family toxin [candidate division NC10 bacterium]
MAEALLDADVIIWFLRGDKATAELIRKFQLEGLPGCSVITRFEIKAGMRPSEQQVTEAFLDSLTDYPVTAEIADQAAEYYRALRARGKMVDLPDLIVAATAKAYRLVVVTYNAEHFSVPDLTLYPLSAPTGKPRRS